ncbi:hypothetical protein AAC387_Pa01g1820 [Persea americana]
MLHHPPLPSRNPVPKTVLIWPPIKTRRNEGPTSEPQDHKARTLKPRKVEKKKKENKSKNKRTRRRRRKTGEAAAAAAPPPPIALQQVHRYML